MGQEELSEDWYFMPGDMSCGVEVLFCGAERRTETRMQEGYEVFAKQHHGTRTCCSHACARVLLLVVLDVKMGCNWRAHHKSIRVAQSHCWTRLVISLCQRSFVLLFLFSGFFVV
jgi:hypothetical protein